MSAGTSRETPAVATSTDPPVPLNPSNTAANAVDQEVAMKALTRTFRYQTLLILSLLALVVALAPAVGAAECGESAHPSGKDRCEEPGGSGTQGDAASDPDDNGNPPERSNGGADEPGGPGGVNKDDQDGNNGCGNDQDFEDDNEGLCLGPQAPASVVGSNTPKTKKETKVKPATFERTPDGTRVLPRVIEDEPVADDTQIGQPIDGRVLPPAARVPGASTAPSDDELPAIGLNLMVGLMALASILMGTVLVRRKRSAKTS